MRQLPSWRCARARWASRRPAGTCRSSTRTSSRWAPASAARSPARAPNPHYPLGYWNDEEAGRGVFGGEWFHTRTPPRSRRGRLLLVRGPRRRRDHLRGLRIGPFEVESRASSTLPSRRPRGRVARRAPWQRRQGVRRASPRVRATDELGRRSRSSCAGRLSAYAYPRIVEFVDDLPKTLTGKIRRIELREREQRTGGAGLTWRAPTNPTTASPERLEELLEVETFPPPEQFARDALLNDPAIYERAAPTPSRGGRSRPTPCTGSATGTRRSTTPTRPSTRGSTGGKLNASHNCLDRHVEAGLGDRVAFHWHGEEGEERDDHVRRLLADVQRFANALKEQASAGRRRRDLPADDPRGRRRDARLRADRRAAQRRLRRLLARVGARADGVLRGQGADHRRRRAAQGQDGAGQGAVDEDRRCRSPRRSSSCATPAIDCAMGEGDVCYDEVMEAADPVCPAEPLDAEHPLFILYSSARRPSRRASCTRPAAT